MSKPKTTTSDVRFMVDAAIDMKLVSHDGTKWKLKTWKIQTGGMSEAAVHILEGMLARGDIRLDVEGFAVWEGK